MFRKSDYFHYRTTRMLRVKMSWVLQQKQILAWKDYLVCIISFLHGVSSLSTFFVFYCIYDGSWNFGLISFYSTNCCDSDYMKYHSWVNYFFLYLKISLILSCFCVFFSFLLRLCLIDPSLRLVSLLPWTLTMFSCHYHWLVPSLSCCLLQPLFINFSQNIPSLVNPHVIVPNDPYPAYNASFIIPLTFHLVLVIWRGWIPPLPSKIGDFQILLWCSVLVVNA